jgi:AraC-like DNA-binding protein
LRPYFSHISQYDLVSLTTLITGLTLGLLLGFVKNNRRKANLFLIFALTVTVMKTGGLTAIFLPALGPTLYFYVRQLTRPERRLRWEDLLHFCIMPAAPWLPAWLVLISVIGYLYISHRLIDDFYRRLRSVLMDRPRFAFRGLDRALLFLGLTCALSLLNDAISLALAFELIGMAAAAVVKPDVSTSLTLPIADRFNAREKGRRLKETVAANRLYEDAELTLTSLAVKLSIHPHDLSRIMNLGLEKNFSDFINEFRVREVARKMQDPACDKLTLLGIAYESGFNSERTFHRVFKEMTGKTPLEYKNSLRKELPIDKLATLSRIRPVILPSGSLPTWAPGKLKRNGMLKNYVKIAWRNLLQHKVYSFINIAGLTTGLAASILILLWVQNELNYDRFQKNAGQIYRIVSDFGDAKTSANSAGMPAGLRAELPVVKNTVRIQPADPILFEAGNKKFQEEHVLYADPSFMDIFSYSLAEGDASAALKRPDAVILTRAMARKYFGDQDPIGKVLHKDNQENVIVTGVLADIPANSDLQFDCILPMASLARSNTDLRNNVWDNFNFWDYIQLDKGFDASPASLAKLETQIDQIFHQHSPQTRALFHLQPLAKIHLAPERLGDMPGHGNVQYVSIFFFAAILILVVACINFMNLATARSARRAKEIGLRKVAGAIRGQLILQFLSESVLTAFLSLLLAQAIVWLALPAFNELADRKLNLDFLSLQLWLGLTGIALLTGLMSGSYPAFYLSGFNPVKVLRGNVKSMGGNLMFRNILVVLQFAVSIVLLIGTVVIYSQLRFIKGRNPGFEKSNLVYIPMTGDLWRRQRALKDELAQNSLTNDFAITSQLPTNLGDWTLAVNWEGKDPHSQQSIPIMQVNEDFTHTMGMQLVAGRSFSRAFKSDSGNYMINEKMVQIMRLTPNSVVGKPLTVWGNRGMIVGVVKDFNFKPIQQAIEPLVMPFNKGGVCPDANTAGEDQCHDKSTGQNMPGIEPCLSF